MPRCSPIVSDCDADLTKYAWFEDRHGYPKRTPKRQGKQSNDYLHRVILSRIIGRELSAGEMCDHINGDKMDCTRPNLRVADKFLNAQNKRKTRGVSRYSGVARQSGSRDRWVAQVGFRKAHHYLGSYDTEEAAARAVEAFRASIGHGAHRQLIESI